MPPGHLMKPGQPMWTPRFTWLGNLLWRLRRWNARVNCESNHHHGPEEQEVRGTLARVRWCRRCSHVEWID